MKKILASIVGVSVVVLFLGFVIVNDRASLADASVSRSHEYQATTTSTGRFSTGPQTLQTYPGAFGSVIITGAAAGVMNFYDATTTNSSLRDSSQATSSLLIASFPTSAAVGVYTFDQIVKRGLVVDIIGTMPTTTITYR